MKTSSKRPAFIGLRALFGSMFMAVLAMVCTGCQSWSDATHQPPLKATDKYVDLKRFMGDWYIIAHLPSLIEEDAYNGRESYQLNVDGTIATTYVFNQGNFDGPLKTYQPRGTVFNPVTNSEWRMQFLWPFNANYLITYVDDSYQTTIIGVPGRDYAWIMARTKTVSDARYQTLVKMLADSGHDVSRLRRMPQR
jgi:apolipoprotein D and lipocalin family protein